MISDRLTVVIHSHGEPRNNWLLKILDSSVIQDFHQVKKRANLRLNHINSKKDGFCLVTRVWQKKFWASMKNRTRSELQIPHYDALPLGHYGDDRFNFMMQSV